MAHLFARLSRAFVEASTAKLPQAQPSAAVAEAPVAVPAPLSATLTPDEFSRLRILATLRPSFTIAIIGSSLPVPFGMFLAKWLFPPHALADAALMFAVLVALLVAVNVVARWWFGPSLAVSRELFIAAPNWLGAREAVPLRRVSLAGLESLGFSARILGGPVRLEVPGSRALVVYPGLYRSTHLQSFIAAARAAQGAAT
jgi:hypothetical protein